MKKTNLFKHSGKLAIMLTLLLFSCYNISRVVAPKTVAPNTAYDGRIVMTNVDNNGPQTGYSMFAVCVPSDWNVTVAEGAYKQYAAPGTMTEGYEANVNLDVVYSPNYSAICNDAFPREGYTWVGFRTKNVYRRSLQGSGSNGCDSIAFDFQVLNNGVAGSYDIDYIVGNIECNDENPDAVEAWTGNPLNSDLFTTATFGVEGTDFKHVNAAFHSVVTVEEGGTPTYNTPSLTAGTETIAPSEAVTITYKNLPKNAKIATYKYNAVVPMKNFYTVNSESDERFYNGEFTIDGLEPGVYHVKALTPAGVAIDGCEEAVFTVSDYEALTGDLGKIMVLGGPGIMAPELLVNDGDAFAASVGTNPNLYQMSPEIVQAQLDKVIAAAPTALFVVGDLTKKGELVSHNLLASKLDAVAKAGIKVFVVPGANDIANPEAASFDGATATKVESISKEAFATLYAPYGYESAETRDANTLSYMAYVNDKIAVIALDGCEFSADGDSLIISGSLTQETITWMESACATAQATGRKVVAIASHLVTIPYNGYATLGTMMNNNDAIDLIGSILGGGTDGTSAPKYEIDNATIKEKIAHCGITAVFTAGHNSTDIQTVVAEDPTYQFVQVNSGFATAYECPLRTVAFTESGINISTEFLKDLPNFVGTPFEDLAYQSTFTGFPKMVEKVVAERWESIDAFLKKNFIFEVDTTGTALISDMNIFFKLPQTPEEMAEIINTSIVPPLLKVVTTLAQGNEDKRDSEGLLAEFHNGVDGIFLGLLQPDYRTNTIIAPLILSSIKDGFAGAGLDVDALVDGIVGSIVYNFVGSDPTQVTNDLYLTAPYGTFDETLGIKDIENTQISNSNSQMYNLQGIRVADNYRGIVIKNNKKYIAK